MPDVDTYPLVTSLADTDTLLAVTGSGLKQIAKPDLVPDSGSGNIDGGSAGSTYSPGQLVDGGGA